MPIDKYLPSFWPPARAAYMGLPEIDQTAINRRVDFLCGDPWLDGETKFPFEAEPESWLYVETHES